MFKWEFDQVEDFKFASIETGSECLWILHADKIPPHIGISKGASYFSLKVDGKDEALELTVLKKLIAAKKIPTLVVSLKVGLDEHKIAKQFGLYTTASANKCTCLTPIKSVLNELEVSKLNQLLAALNSTGKIQSVHGLYLPQDYQGIPEYTEQDIHTHLNQLKGEPA